MEDVSVFKINEDLLLHSKPCPVLPEHTSPVEVLYALAISNVLYIITAGACGAFIANHNYTHCKLLTET